MKKILPVLLFFLAGYNNILAQNVGIGTPTPDHSAALDITATNMGILIPRTRVMNISAPANGVMIYDMDSACFVFYNGTNWRSLCSVGTEASPTSSCSCKDTCIKVHVTSATLLDIADSIPEIVPSQGAGTIIRIISIYVYLNAGTIPFNFSGPLFIGTCATCSDGGYLPPGTLLNSSSSVLICQVQALTPGSVSNVNAPLILNNMNGSTVSQGNGSIDIYIKYSVVTL